MSISYEEALSTLQAMFGDPWSRDSLDSVLRHYKGHMENTVESILAHQGQDPQVLLNNLKNGGTNATNLDEELARQLSSQVEAEASTTPTPASTPSSSSNLRGTPTTLPDDFLRVNTTTSQATLNSDEALARMLQDALFSEELRRNPDFAHLAGGRRPSNSNPQGQQRQPQAVNRASFTARGHQPVPMPNIMEKLSEMGTSARFKLQAMADQFKQNTNRMTGGAGAGGDESPRTEMRGLLDRDDSHEAYELASRKDL